MMLERFGAYLSSTQVVLLCAFAALLLAAQPSHAQSAYESLLDHGAAAYEAMEFARARESFAQAHALEPGGRTLRMLGYCDANLARFALAARELEQALADTRNPLTDGQRSEVAETLARARNETGTLRLKTRPEQVELVLDGAAVLGHQFSLDPGDHTLTASAAEHQSSTLIFTIVKGREQTASLTLAPIPTDPPAVAAAIVPEARTAPAAPPRDDERKADAAAGGRVRGIVGLSVGGAALVAGGVAGMISLAKTNDEQARCVDGHCPKARADELASANTLANVANVGLALGVVGLGYGLYELLTLPSTPDAQTTGLRVELSATGATLRGTL